MTAYDYLFLVNVIHEVNIVNISICSGLLQKHVLRYERSALLGWLIISQVWNTHDYFYSWRFGGISDEIFIKFNQKY